MQNKTFDMNHAFLIEAHDSPELLQRIVDRLNAPNHYLFIHLDGKSNTAKINTSHIGGIYQIINELKFSIPVSQ